MTPCICGCRRPARQLHHVVYQQELRRAARAMADGDLRALTLVRDTRNLVPVHALCHEAHHGRSRPLQLHTLPASAFAFAAEVLGAGPAYEYLNRRYAGSDIRLERLLEDVAA